MHFTHVGRIDLSASRRLTIGLRSERSEGAVIDLRLQVSDGTGWRSTSAGVSLPADHLPELLAALERAVQRLPEV